VLRTLYRDAADYRRQVERRYDALVREGWALPHYRAVIVGDAAGAAF
jgi:hypothetical protein